MTIFNVLQRFGRIGAVRKLPIYLCNVNGRLVPTDDLGVPYDDAELKLARLSRQELVDFLFENMAAVAKLLDQKSTEKISINNPGDGSAPAILVER